MKRLLAIGALGFAAGLIWAAPVSATYPGQNGLIAYLACSDCERGVDGIGAANPDGTGYHLLATASEAGTPEDPAWSPSGQLLAYSFLPNNPGSGLAGIYVANPDGSDPRQLASGPDENPAFSP